MEAWEADNGELLRRLGSFLTESNVTKLIGPSGPSTLTEEQRGHLKQLSRHFPTTSITKKKKGSRKTGKRSRDETDSSDDDSADDRPSKRKWHPMDVLKNNMTIAEDIQSFIHMYPDPRNFFSDVTAKDTEPAGDKMARQIEKGHVGEYLAFCVEYIDKISVRHAMDAVRKAFAWLACYDLVMKINRSSRHQWSGTKFGKNIEARIMNDVLGGSRLNEFDDEADEQGKRQVLRSFELYCQRGSRMAALCDRFGEGCLFRFARCFNDDFVDRRLTKKGQTYDRVMEDLSHHNIQSLDARSGILGYAQNVRRFCSIEFHSADPAARTVITPISHNAAAAVALS